MKLDYETPEGSTHGCADGDRPVGRQRHDHGDDHGHGRTDDAIIAVGGVAPAPELEPDACVVGGAVAADQSAELGGRLPDAAGRDGRPGGRRHGTKLECETPIGDWEGVAGTGTGRVTHIYLRGRRVWRVCSRPGLPRWTPGEIDADRQRPDGRDPGPERLGQHQVLVLGGNAFTGGIPATLGDLDSLLRLWLHRNDGGFEGGIPPSSAACRTSAT